MLDDFEWLVCDLYLCVLNRRNITWGGINKVDILRGLGLTYPGILII